MTVRPSGPAAAIATLSADPRERELDAPLSPRGSLDRLLKAARSGQPFGEADDRIAQALGLNDRAGAAALLGVLREEHAAEIEQHRREQLLVNTEKPWQVSFEINTSHDRAIVALDEAVARVRAALTERVPALPPVPSKGEAAAALRDVDAVEI